MNGKQGNMTLLGAIIGASVALLIGSTMISNGNYGINRVAYAQGNSSQPTPPLDQNVVWQGTISSSASKLPGHED